MANICANNSCCPNWTNNPTMYQPCYEVKYPLQIPEIQPINNEQLMIKKEVFDDNATASSSSLLEKLLTNPNNSNPLPYNNGIIDNNQKLSPLHTTYDNVYDHYGANNNINNNEKLRNPSSVPIVKNEDYNEEKGQINFPWMNSGNTRGMYLFLLSQY